MRGRSDRPTFGGKDASCSSSQPADAGKSQGDDGGGGDAKAPLGPPACASTAIDVKSQGAKGDGTTDDTAAIQRAITMAGSSKQVLVSAGTYVISKALNLPAGADLCGSGSPVLTSTSAGYILQSPESGITITG